MLIQVLLQEPRNPANLMMPPVFEGALDEDVSGLFLRGLSFLGIEHQLTMCSISTCSSTSIRSEALSEYLP